MSDNININNNNNPSRYLCSLDGAELWDLYNPAIDEDLLLSTPDRDDLTEFERDAIESRSKTLRDMLMSVNPSKRTRLTQMISEGSSIIFVCPHCKKVYDSTNPLFQDKTHGDDNSLPIKKPKQHKVVSDDRESVEKATTSPFDNTVSSPQVFTSVSKRTDSQGRPIEGRTSGTNFGRVSAMQLDRDINGMGKSLNAMIEKYGKDNVNIQIHIPDPDVDNNNNNNNNNNDSV